MSEDAQQKPAAPPPAGANQPAHDQPTDAAPDSTPPDSSDEHEASAGESVRRIAAVAANPGATAAKMSLRARSRQSLKVGTSSATFTGAKAHGDMAGRDINKYFSLGPRGVDDTYEISIDERVANGAWYVTPAGLDTLVSFCSKRAVAVIRVATGQGKFATALRVADELCTGQLYRLSPKEGLDKLDRDYIEEKAGYLLTGLSQEQANATLTRHGLARMAAELAAKDAKLIIAVGTETRLAQLKAADCLTELTETPACRDVLSAHLDHLIGTRQADELLASERVAALLDKELTAAPGPRPAMRLANLLADAYLPDRTSDDIAVVVEQELSRWKEQEFQDWFAQLDSLDKYGFVIALAVLNGLPYETVVQTGRMLEDRLTKPLHGNVQNLARDQVQPFRASLSTRLREFDAKLADSATAPGVVFNEPDRPQQLLLHVWREYGDAHAALVNWLRELGSHPMDEVRVRAAVAVAKLASEAFEYVRRHVIDVWADSKDKRFRESAAVAADAANSDPALKENARSLAQEWSATGRPHLIATGLLVYGGSVGLDHPGELFDALDQHAETDKTPVLEAVCESLTELVEAGVVGVSDRALMTAKSWVTSRNSDRRFTGCLAFLTMAADLLWSEDDAASGEASHRDRWPLLLRLSEISTQWRGVIATLWAAALFDSVTADAAVEVLDKWAESVESNGARRAAFVRLIRATATSDRVVARLRRAVESWANPNNSVPAPLIATSLADLARTAAQPIRERT